MLDLDTTKQYGAVCYSDGGARPNPGFTGFGIHGYIFEKVEAEKPTLIRNNFFGSNKWSIPTNKGYADCDQTGKPTRRPAVGTYNVTPLHYLDFSGSGASLGTNNNSELRAFYHLLLAFKDTPVKDLTSFLDSEYVLKGINGGVRNMERRGWVNSEGLPVANIDMWQLIWECYQQMQSNGFTFTSEWIRAHTGAFGNSQADFYATMGVFRAPEANNPNTVVFSPAKKYWDVNVVRHPFLNFKRIYYNLIEKYNVPGHYYTADPGGVDELVGKRTAEEGYAVIRFNEPVKHVEAVRARQFDFDQDINAIMMLKTDLVFSKDIYGYLDKYGKYCIQRRRSTYKKESNDLSFLDDTPIAIEQSPVGLLLRTMDAMSLLDEILDRFQEYKSTGNYNVPANNIELHAHEITDVFYTQGVKRVGKEDLPKWELKPEFIQGYRDHTVEISESFKGEMQTVKVPLILGTDLLPRMGLKQLEVECPRIYLITWRESEFSLRYATVIESASGVGIWSNFFADKLFFRTTV